MVDVARRDGVVAGAVARRDLAALEGYAFASPEGFGARRLECWAVFLGVDLGRLAPIDVAGAAAASGHGERGTVDKDVARSL